MKRFWGNSKAETKRYGQVSSLPDNAERQVAQMRIVGRGAAYIPSEEIAQLPEVKEMQRWAAMIVSGKAASARK
ncbi:hypothetical protein SerAS12_4074 [Serratia sp. AS12]|uniref:hypothetical protein n=1 Tax=Serratia TaxID=613 RepID=UPI00020EA026|nr:MULTISPECIES: hypothetical protein [Serratia]AEF47172.1 hypothetical protein SerAS9_4073 [Serratia plymuthica AS9]AEF52124.1 hypothetical protein SerAS12_4074 [Serratia sp. AS12]AEG29831.1 hypothetical protein SerAS13_4074 [Serratia sp. AS13]UTN95858.1 hypothetical protein NLX81_20730 [Serratia plymuthica]